MEGASYRVDYHSVGASEDYEHSFAKYMAEKTKWHMQTDYKTSSFFRNGQTVP